MAFYIIKSIIIINNFNKNSVFFRHAVAFFVRFYYNCRKRKVVFAMTGNEYQKLAMVTLNKELDKKEMLTNSVMGLCGESGEACDIVKKHLFHGHELDRDSLIKELGDVAWYLAEAAAALDISLDEVLERNVEKLRKRYPEGFSSEKSINRTE